MFALVLACTAVDNLSPAQFLDLLVSFVPRNTIVVFFFYLDRPHLSGDDEVHCNRSSGLKRSVLHHSCSTKVPLISSLCNKPVDETIA